MAAPPVTGVCLTGQQRGPLRRACPLDSQAPGRVPHHHPQLDTRRLPAPLGPRRAPGHRGWPARGGFTPPPGLRQRGRTRWTRASPPRGPAPGARGRAGRHERRPPRHAGEDAATGGRRATVRREGAGRAWARSRVTVFRSRPHARALWRVPCPWRTRACPSVHRSRSIMGRSPPTRVWGALTNRSVISRPPSGGGGIWHHHPGGFLPHR